MASESQRLQGKIVSLLTDVYPITTTAPAGSRIRNLKTARNSEYWQQNEEEAAALGYIAHFVFLLSVYLAVPLRYPIRPLSSHSYILDPVSLLPETSDVPVGSPPYSLKRDKRYPLFLERGGGAASARLSWAVFLLNKDIEQLLQARGLVCGDLRHSLRNLEALVLWLVSTPSVAPAVDTISRRRPDEAGEITNHEDLIAAQLRSQIDKGKGRMEAPVEKGEEDDDTEEHLCTGL